MSWSNYILDTSELLNDVNNAFTSKNQLTRWINVVRRDLAKQTQCLQRVITGQSAYGASAQPGSAIPSAMQPNSLPNSALGTPTVGAATNNFTTIPNVERYPYIGFFNPALQSQHAGVNQVLEVFSLSVNWGGSWRPSLDYMPWNDLQAYLRAFSVLNSSYPSVWSILNDGTDGEVWLFPPPTTYGEMEAQVFCLPSPIYSDDDFDAIPDGFKEAVKFGAAELAFMQLGRYDQAFIMHEQMINSAMISRVSADTGKIRSYYSG